MRATKRFMAWISSANVSPKRERGGARTERGESFPADRGVAARQDQSRGRASDTSMIGMPSRTGKASLAAAEMSSLRASS